MDSLIMTSESPTDPDLITQLRAGGLAGQWLLDTTRSEARFATRSLWGAVPVRGAFTDLTGQATVSAHGEAQGRRRSTGPSTAPGAASPASPRSRPASP
jgi:polyisoprenoid-binding protein YceI